MLSGKTTEAAAVVDHVNDLYATARAAHPEFEGATGAVTFYFDDKPGAYASQDGRSRILTDLGFTIPAKFDELAGAFSFGSPLSIEYALEQLVPELALAVDGDPATAVPSAAALATAAG